MAMSDCPECWETPCVCGHEYKDRPDEWRLKLAGVVLPEGYSIVKNPEVEETPERPLYTDPGPFKKPIDATPEEMAAARKIRAKMDVLEARQKANRAEGQAIKAEIVAIYEACPHTAFYDKDCFPWAMRYCGACGIHMETI